ncbi:hypothetical protein FKM82_027844 [Ascaphus truei]
MGPSPQHGRNVLQIMLLHRVHEAGHPDNGAAAEVPRDALVVSRGAHQHHLELRVQPPHLLQQDEQEVRVHVPLVDLVHHHVADALQPGVGLQLLQEDAHRAEEQGAPAGGHHALQPHLVAHVPAQAGPQLLAHAVSHGHGADPSRLGDEQVAAGALPAQDGIL